MSKSLQADGREVRGQDPRYWSPANGTCKGQAGREHKSEEGTVVTQPGRSKEIASVSLGEKVERFP